MTDILSHFLSSLCDGYKTRHNLEGEPLRLVLENDSCKGCGKTPALRLVRKISKPKSRWESGLCHGQCENDSHAENGSLALGLLTMILEEEDLFAIDSYRRSSYDSSPRLTQRSKECTDAGISSKSEENGVVIQTAASAINQQLQRLSNREHQSPTSVIWRAGGDRSPSIPKRSSEECLPLRMSLVDAIHRTLERRQPKGSYRDTIAKSVQADH
jgi:hypothetical protein